MGTGNSDCVKQELVKVTQIKGEEYHASLDGRNAPNASSLDVLAIGSPDDNGRREVRFRDSNSTFAAVFYEGLFEPVRVDEEGIPNN